MHCHRSFTGHSFGTKHSKIITFINAATLMNKCCKYFSSEWPNEAHSVPQRVSLYSSLLYLNKRGAFSPSLLYASRLPCALTAAYEWQLLCSHRHVLENHFSLFPASKCLLSSKYVIQESGGELMGNSVTFLLPACGILYEKTDFKNFLGNHFKPTNEPFTIFLPLHASGQPGRLHLPKQNFQDRKCKMSQKG